MPVSRYSKQDRGNPRNTPAKGNMKPAVIIK